MVYTSRCVVCELGLTEKLEQGSFSRTGVVRLFHFSLGAAADRAFAKKNYTAGRVPYARSAVRDVVRSGKKRSGWFVSNPVLVGVAYTHNSRVCLVSRAWRLLPEK